jgi:hypothetical protein
MYITPRVKIQQEFLQVPIYREFPLPAFIIGPNYSLTRYSVDAEKYNTAIGTADGMVVATGNSYVAGSNVRYDFPNIAPGGDVDPTYTKVFAEAIEAQYFPHASLNSVGNGANSVTFMTGPSGQKYTNKVRFTNANLVTANGFTRSSYFSHRDVAVGDIIEITDALGNNVKGKITKLEAETHEIDSQLASKIAPHMGGSFTTYHDGSTNGTTTFTSATANFSEYAEEEVVGQVITIAGIGSRKIVSRISDTTVTLDRPVASSGGANLNFYVGGVYNDEDNTAPASLNISNTVNYVTGSGSNAGITVGHSETSAYVGYKESNIVSDVYTVTVTSGINLSNATFSVASQSGAFATKTGVTAPSGVVTIDDTGHNDVQIHFTLALGTNFTVGSAWTYAVTAAVTQVVPEIDEDSVYTGASDMVYTLRVERGGAFFDGTNSASCAKIIITSSNVDNSSVVLPVEGEYFNVGSFGVRAAFMGGSIDGGLLAGDAYYIPVKAAVLGAVSIVEFSENLPLATVATTPETTMTAKLFLTQKSIQVPAVRDLLTGATNWDQEGPYITINAGITTYDNGLVYAESPVRLPVVSANLFVEHRDLLQNNISAISSVTNLADVSTLLGTVHPDNPLAQGVYDAVLNAKDTLVYFIAVGSDDLAGYNQAIKISEKSDKVYSFVPMTFNRDIQEAIIAHVNAYSTPDVGRWRIAWISVEDKKNAVIYDLKENGTPYTATITDDPALSGVQNKLVTVAGAKFIEDGVRTNDTIRLNFNLSPDGALVYDEYVVDHVRSNTTLTITTALPQAVSVPVKVQVVRNYTKSERAYNISHVGGDFNNRRVRCVFPDTYKSQDGTIKQGYIAAAGLAGLRSGVVPHQGLTNSEYLGAYDLSKVVTEFSQDDLNTMAEQGIWIITQEVIGATAYVRHQLTTDTSGLNTSEDSITTNVDNISYALRAALAPYIGKYNINPESVAEVRAEIVGMLTYFATETWVARAGNQLVSFTPKDDIIKIQQDPYYKDRIACEVRLHVPYPMNYINLKLIVAG